MATDTTMQTWDINMSTTRKIYDIDPWVISSAIDSKEMWIDHPWITKQEEDWLIDFFKTKYPDQTPEFRRSKVTEAAEKMREGWQTTTPTQQQPQDSGISSSRLIQPFDTSRASSRLRESTEKTMMWESDRKSDRQWLMALWELWLKTAANIPIWAINAGKDIFDMATDPIGTVKWFYKMWLWVKDYLSWEDTENSQIIKDMLELAKDSFSSQEAAIETLTENPFDFISLISPKTAANITRFWTKWIQKAWEIATSWAKRTVSGLTWVPTEAIDEAIRAGWKTEFTDAMRWNVDPMSVVQDAKAWLESIVSSKRSLYWEWWDAIKESYSDIDLVDLKQSFIDKLEEKKIKVIPSEDWFELDFSQSTLRKTSEWTKELQDTLDDIMTWTDSTVDGMDTLKQRIRSGYVWSKNTWLSDAIHTDFAWDIAKQLWENVEWYADITKKYAELTNVIEEVKKSFALWQNKLPQQTYNKIMKIYKWDKELTRELFEQIDNLSNKDMAAQIAWLQFKNLAPSGIMWQIIDASLVIWAAKWAIWLETLMLMWLSSPRVMWEVLWQIWLQKQKVTNVVNNMSKLKAKVDEARKFLPKVEPETALQAWVWAWNIADLTEQSLEEE